MRFSFNFHFKFVFLLWLFLYLIYFISCFFHFSFFLKPLILPFLLRCFPDLILFHSFPFSFFISFLDALLLSFFLSFFLFPRYHPSQVCLPFPSLAFTFFLIYNIYFITLPFKYFFLPFFLFLFSLFIIHLLTTLFLLTLLNYAFLSFSLSNFFLSFSTFYFISICLSFSFVSFLFLSLSRLLNIFLSFKWERQTYLQDGITFFVSFSRSASSFFYCPPGRCISSSGIHFLFSLI